MLQEILTAIQHKKLEGKNYLADLSELEKAYKDSEIDKPQIALLLAADFLFYNLPDKSRHYVTLGIEDAQILLKDKILSKTDISHTLTVLSDLYVLLLRHSKTNDEIFTFLEEIQCQKYFQNMIAVSEKLFVYLMDKCEASFDLYFEYVVRYTTLKHQLNCVYSLLCHEAFKRGFSFREFVAFRENKSLDSPGFDRKGTRKCSDTGSMHFNKPLYPPDTNEEIEGIDSSGLNRKGTRECSDTDSMQPNKPLHPSGTYEETQGFGSARLKSGRAGECISEAIVPNVEAKQSNSFEESHAPGSDRDSTLKYSDNDLSCYNSKICQFDGDRERGSEAPKRLKTDENYTNERKKTTITDSDERDGVIPETIQNTFRRHIQTFGKLESRFPSEIPYYLVFIRPEVRLVQKAVDHILCMKNNLQDMNTLILNAYRTNQPKVLLKIFHNLENTLEAYNPYLVYYKHLFYETFKRKNGSAMKPRVLEVPTGAADAKDIIKNHIIDFLLVKGDYQSILELSVDPITNFVCYLELGDILNAKHVFDTEICQESFFEEYLDDLRGVKGTINDTKNEGSGISPHQIKNTEDSSTPGKNALCTKDINVQSKKKTVCRISLDKGFKNRKSQNIHRPKQSLPDTREYKGVQSLEPKHITKFLVLIRDDLKLLDIMEAIRDRFLFFECLKIIYELGESSILKTTIELGMRKFKDVDVNLLKVFISYLHIEELRLSNADRAGKVFELIKELNFHEIGRSADLRDSPLFDNRIEEVIHLPDRKVISDREFGTICLNRIEGSETEQFGLIEKIDVNELMGSNVLYDYPQNTKERGSETGGISMEGVFVNKDPLVQNLRPALNQQKFITTSGKTASSEVLYAFFEGNTHVGGNGAFLLNNSSDASQTSSRDLFVSSNDMDWIFGVLYNNALDLLEIHHNSFWRLLIIMLKLNKRRFITDINQLLIHGLQLYQSSSIQEYFLRIYKPLFSQYLLMQEKLTYELVAICLRLYPRSEIQLNKKGIKTLSDDQLLKFIGEKAIHNNLRSSLIEQAMKRKISKKDIIYQLLEVLRSSEHVQAYDLFTNLDAELLNSPDIKEHLEHRMFSLRKLKIYSELRKYDIIIQRLYTRHSTPNNKNM